MLTSEMFKFVENHMDFINKQVSEGNGKAINLGLIYNMNLDYMDRASITTFERAFLSWYEKFGMEVEGKVDEEISASVYGQGTS